jgi:hypothetical protein
VREQTARPAPAGSRFHDVPGAPAVAVRPLALPADGTEQVFSLKDIQVQPDKTFSAKLTWWQTNSWCATRDVPIVGRQTISGGIAFDVPRMCGISYLAELNRSSSGWVGKASSMSGYGLMLDLRAD